MNATKPIDYQNNHSKSLFAVDIPISVEHVPSKVLHAEAHTKLHETRTILVYGHDLTCRARALRSDTVV